MHEFANADLSGAEKPEKTGHQLHSGGWCRTEGRGDYITEDNTVEVLIVLVQDYL
jgi:hypothetical protein